MKTRHVRYHLIAASYTLVRISFGLLRHPYQTMHQLFTHRLTQWLVLSPVFYFLIALFCWRLLIRPLVITFLSATCGLMLIKTTVVFFTFFWQLSLLYLYLKFRHNRKDI